MFPFTVYGHNDAGGAAISYTFSALFHSHRPSGLFWFEADVIILGPEYVRFDVFERTKHIGYTRDTWYRDPEVIWTKTVRCSPTLTRRLIQQRAIEQAEARRERELQDAEDRIVADYTNELLDSIYKDTP